MEEQRVPVEVPLVLLSTFIRQCTSPYASGVYSVKEPSGGVSYVYTEAGDICISPDPIPPPQLPPLDKVVRLSAYGKSQRHPELQRLTNVLKAVTETAVGVVLDDFEITWGTWENEKLPFLMYVHGTVSGDIDLSLVNQIALCLAIEMTVVPEPGKCITPDRTCFAAKHTIERKKVVLYRVRKFFGPRADNDTVMYVIKRLEGIDQRLTVSSVKCCQHCFNMYTRTVRPATGTKGRGVSRAGSRANADNKSSKSKTAVQQPVEPPEGLPALSKKKSGLALTQHVSFKTEYKARALYANPPFPMRRLK